MAGQRYGARSQSRPVRRIYADAESVLASPARNLAAIVAFVLTVMVFATLGYMAAGWSFADASYMVLLTVYTVGYGEEARGRAIGTWSAAAAIMTAIGPPLGGWLVDSVGWRSIFFINPPIAVVTLLLATRLAPDQPARRAERPDLAGSGLAILTLGLFCYGLIAMGEGMRMAGAAVGIAAIPAGALFLLVESKSKAPMLPLALFRNRNFAGANALTVVLYAALSGALFMLPYMLIKVQGYSATAAGASFVPFAVIMGAGSRWTGGFSDRFGARLPLIGGPLVTACGFVWLAVAGHLPNYWISVFPGLVLVGIGMTFAIPPLTTTIFNAVAPEASGT
eukprot:gene35861-48228_t